MTRTNKPYNSKKYVTEEEVRIATETPSFEVNRVELILRMWEEIKDLREVLRKQIY